MALKGPSLAFPFGTDNLGRDIFSRVIDGTRISVSLALVTGVSIASIGVVVGAIAGYVGSWLDAFLMRVVDVLLAFPTLILSLAIAGTLGAGYGTLLVALISTWWPTYARLVRAGVLAERERQYVDAIRGLGARPRRLVVRHILPNVLPPVLVLLSFDLGAIILAIAALGYLGVGVPPPAPEWGTMISDAQTYVFSAPHMIIFPGLAVAVAVIGFNLFGEGMRNALDPLRERSRPRFARRGRSVVAAAASPSAPGDDALLVIDGLQTRLGHPRGEVRAVDGVSFCIRAGETVGLVGESGCGKTMTALSVMRLLPPGGRIVAGSVRLDQQELTALSDANMRRMRGSEVAMVFQDPQNSLNPTMTIGDQVCLPLRRHAGLSKSQARERAAELLAMVGLPRPAERLHDYPHQLSGGQRQRVTIAMALAGEPELLIADEPTTALDVTIQAQILALLADLQERLGMAMLLVTHDMAVIAGRADRVLVMYAGRIVEEGSTAQIFSRPRHPYTRALLDSIPQLAQERGAVLNAIPGLPPDLIDVPSGCAFAPRCGNATQRCSDSAPALTQDGSDHRYACFHPVEPDSPGRSASAVMAPVAAVAEASPEAALLVVDHLVKSFPVRSSWGRHGGRVHAVSDVSFSVLRGETFGIVGESGCGKTTLARMLVALEEPESGSVRLAGVDLARLSPPALRQRRGDFQMVFQDSHASLDPRARVGAALREPMAVQRVGNRGDRDERVARLLHEVGLDPWAVSRYPHEFSGGQRQRIGLARALSLDPGLIVADEPVSSLDVSIRAQVLNLMRSLQSSHGLTLVVISHDLSVVRYLADRVAVMYLGKLVEIGPTRVVYERSAHPYTAGLLSAVPVPDPDQERSKKAFTLYGELASPIDPPSGCRFRTRCPRAELHCAEVEPPLRALGASGRRVACHFPLVSDDALLPCCQSGAVTSP
ncbi:MAG: dipeptide ABC transporter ATP-binding protein [Acidimicrobiales bacterium]